VATDNGDRPGVVAPLTERSASGSASSRDKILDAAVQVALRDGIVAMTLDAVAREAGVSKGGLIYHFHTKDALLASMLEHFSANAKRALEARMAADPASRGRWFRAFVHTIFASDSPSARPGPPSTTDMARFLTAVLAASANNPHLLDGVRQNITQMRARLLAEGPNGMRQVALWPALYGLLLWQHLGILRPDDPLRQSMLDELLRLAEGPPAAGGPE
jgi:AcrR family transcriptional regulator